MSDNVKVVYRLDSNVYKALEQKLGVNYKSVPKDEHESAYRCGVNDVLTALRNGFMEE